MGRHREGVKPDSDPILAAVARNLDAAIIADGRPLNDIALAAKIDPQLVRRICAAARPRLKVEDLVRLAHALGIPVAQLVADLPLPADLAPKPRRKSGS